MEKPTASLSILVARFPWPLRRVSNRPVCMPVALTDCGLRILPLRIRPFLLFATSAHEEQALLFGTRGVVAAQCQTQGVR